MKFRLIDLLQCPRDGSRLTLLDAETKQMPVKCHFDSVRCSSFCGLKNQPIEKANVTPKDCEACYTKEIVSGALESAAGKRYPIRAGIPRILSDEMNGFLQRNYDTFSLEWKMFKFGERNWGQDIEFRKELFLRGMGVTPDQLRGKLILDAGCGSGLLAMEMANSFGMEVVGIDLAGGIDQAYAHNTNPHVHFVQASVLEPPVRAGVANFVYCAGVLVALPDSKDGFKVLAPRVAPGGRFFIWLYHPINAKYHPKDCRKMALYNWIRVNITSRLPIRIQYGIYVVMVVPYLIKRTIMNLLSTKKDDRTWREKMQGFVDMFSPLYQNRHTEEEAMSWYSEVGFNNVGVGYQEEYGFCVRGDRPAASKVS